MDKEFVADTEASPAELFAVVSDLTTFPQWIDLVHQVEALPADPGEEPAWLVTLRAEIGPFARSKRLRMVRTIHRPPSPDDAGLVRFERAELDGRDHAAWTMEVGVEPAVGSGNPGTSRARCRLRYDGALWNRLLEGRLDATADRATVELQQVARSAASGGEQ